MSFLKRIFGKKEKPIKSNEDFWEWFEANENHFFNVIKNEDNIEKNFFKYLSPKLQELREGYYYLTGMFDKDTAELILTPEGTIENIVFTEELIKAAPKLTNWRFTALKPEVGVENSSIEMDKYRFDQSNISFYPIEHEHYPDEVDIAIVYNDYNEADKNTITSGIYIFIDNYLGELNSITTIDNLSIVSKENAEKETIPIEKLKAFLIWREKEFVEKYSSKRYNTEDDIFSILKAESNDGFPLIAAINTTLLEWDSKASHPWVLMVEIKYDGKENNGLPNAATSALHNLLEDEISSELKDADGYLYIGRQSMENVRKLYYTCKEFRKPSKVLSKLKKTNTHKLDFDYTIYKDKYWQSFERFMVN